MADFYDLLGVSRSASGDEIKKAYRKRARELHPDANPDNPEAEAQFKDLARAYQVLSDDQQRSRYDQFGEAGVGGRSGGAGSADDLFGGGLGDIFETFFGGGGGSPFGGGRQRGPAGPPRGQDVEVIADIDFVQAVFGDQIDVQLKLPVRCGTCDGSGAAQDTQPVTCSECGGSGQVQRVRQSLLGQMVTASPCTRCGGLGEVIASPCDTCRGEGRVTEDTTYKVDVPAGVDTGSTLRLTRRGAAGPRKGANGDLYVHLRVQPDERFDRDGDDLVTDVPISIAQAALGTSLTLETLDGDEDLVIPHGTQPGREFILRQRGVPHLQGRGRGDLIARVRVEVPTKLDDSEVALLTKFADARGERVGNGKDGIFSRIKSAFT
ncbi:MAG: molecular chaperone DnaJ [Ilumatobacter sp.]|uniref:molecular chaperone DnaJ n=1 Tax=Ilumatobacter sp. TaxID=1967498 RepID=UPI003296B294